MGSIKASVIFRHVCCFFAVAILLFSGCAPSPERLLDYQNGKIAAEIKGTVNSVEISARLVLFEATDKGSRAFELTMLSPKTLEGMVFCRSHDGQLSATVGEVTVELEAGERSGAVMIADAFSLSDDPRAISAVRGTDVGLPQYSELTRIDFEGISVFLDPDTDTPVKIVSPELEIFVTSFNSP